MFSQKFPFRGTLEYVFHFLFIYNFYASLSCFGRFSFLFTFLLVHDFYRDCQVSVSRRAIVKTPSCPKNHAI